MARTPSDVAEFPPVPALPADAFPESVRPSVESQNSALEEWYEKINGFISFGTTSSLDEAQRAHAGHVDGELIIVTTPAVDADFPVVHNLGRTPLGFIELWQTAEDRLFRAASTPGHTKTQLWVRSGAAVGTRYLILAI